MAIHPFRGERLRIVRFSRDRLGRRFVHLEHRIGVLRLPESWTDLVPSIDAPVIMGRVARVEVHGLKRLADALRGLLERAIALRDSSAIRSVRPREARSVAGDGEPANGRARARSRRVRDASSPRSARGQGERS